MNGTAAAAVSVLVRPFARIPAAWRRQAGLAIVIALAITFPIYHSNDADVDAMANAAAYATLALGLNIVVGFAGLLDLDRKSTRLNSSHSGESRMPSSA